MGLVRLQPDQPPVMAEQTLPQAIQEPSKSIFTTLVPESRIVSLLKYVEGYPWTVNFYGQILNKNNTLENFDPSVPNLNQPYYEVNGMVIQVSSPLSSSYDAATGITTVTGSALSPYSLTPNIGDIFIAAVDSGEDAVFMVNSVIRKTFRKDSIYEINYNLLYYTSEEPDFIANLKARIQDSYFFNKDTNFFNRDVLIKPSVKEAIDRLRILTQESKEYYFSTFAQKEAGTILIPGLPYKVYDPLLLGFLSKIIDYRELADVPFFRHNYGDNKYINQKSIFDLLLTRNINTVSGINKRYNFIPSHMLPNRARLGTVFHTGADYINFPVEPNTATNIDKIAPDAELNSFIESVKSTHNYFIPVIPIQAINNNAVFNQHLLHELFLDDYYIVSENFYNYVNDNSTFANLSYIELLIFKHVTKQAIAKEDLVIAIEKYMEFSLLHQLYLLPVLWFLIKVNS